MCPQKIRTLVWNVGSKDLSCAELNKNSGVDTDSSELFIETGSESLAGQANPLTHRLGWTSLSFLLILRPCKKAHWS